VVAKGNYSRISVNTVAFNGQGDPTGVERHGIALEPEMDYEEYGCEDPRITFVEPLRSYIMTYTAFSALGSRIAIARSENLRDWKRLGLATFSRDGIIDFNAISNKDACFFPKAVMHKGEPMLAMLHRPMLWGNEMENASFRGVDVESQQYPRSIWLSYCHLNPSGKPNSELTELVSHRLLASPSAAWEKIKIGAGTPPVLTRLGWLMVYHGVCDTNAATAGSKSFRYSAGIMIMDSDRPYEIAYRSLEPELSPEGEKEKSGKVDNVVFPTGIDQRNDLGQPDRFDVYYGMADSAIGVARLDLTETIPVENNAMADSLRSAVH
jgi:beta-1,2-mannobiose phosphorylase / 1,2-beta-oligomannan phosphorylase